MCECVEGVLLVEEEESSRQRELFAQRTRTTENIEQIKDYSPEVQKEERWVGVSWKGMKLKTGRGQP